ncbi:hypothetical protein RJ639_020251 [Escallonia herrerae]|uniref:Uncharacterized protein n=1 Tax=Escallonia herrerae TaxID=1293975 RepID=A0AA89AHH6_9ASTE|nr:hypothetical protein RJ639_020251 [Escallonia herrerae]
MVRTQCILPAPFNSRPGPRYNRSDSPSTAGLFTKVSRKPSNHSKFTGKCGKPKCRCCHIDPTHKAKDKVKGTRKIRSAEARYDTRCVDWVVGDARPELSFSGSSATEVLYELNRNSDHLDRTLQLESCWYASWFSDCEEDEETRIDADEVDGRDEDDMSYCDAGLVSEQVEEDDEDPDRPIGFCLSVQWALISTISGCSAVNNLYECPYRGLQFLSTFLEARRPTNPCAASADQDVFGSRAALSSVLKMKGVDKFGDCNFLRQALKDLELLTYEQSSELI